MVIMVEKSSHGVPETGPKTEFARRLEYIRTKIVEEENLKDSLRAFWLELVEDPKDAEFSYEAVRRYHYKTREPPLSYLNRVVEVFPRFRLAWLVDGDGPPTKEEHAEQLRRHYSIPDRPLLEAVTDRHPWLGQLTIGVQQTFMDVLRGLELQSPGGSELDDVQNAGEVEGVLKERLELADDLVFALTVPLRLWGVPFPGILRDGATVSMELPGPPVDVNGYLRQVLGALATVMTTRTPGDPLEERHQSLVAALRRVAEADQLPEEAEPSNEERERAARIQAALTERLEERQQKLDEEGLGFEVESLHPDTEEED